MNEHIMIVVLGVPTTLTLPVKGNVIASQMSLFQNPIESFSGQEDNSVRATASLIGLFKRFMKKIVFYKSIESIIGTTLIAPNQQTQLTDGCETEQANQIERASRFRASRCECSLNFLFVVHGLTLD